MTPFETTEYTLKNYSYFDVAIHHKKKKTNENL